MFVYYRIKFDSKCTYMYNQMQKISDVILDISKEKSKPIIFIIIYQLQWGGESEPT